VQFEKIKTAYSKASKSNPQVMLATPIKPIAAKTMKFDDVKSCAPISNCSEKNVDKTPENISSTIRDLRIEANTSKI